MKMLFRNVFWMKALLKFCWVFSQSEMKVLLSQRELAGQTDMNQLHMLRLWLKMLENRVIHCKRVQCCSQISVRYTVISASQLVLNLWNWVELMIHLWAQISVHRCTVERAWDSFILAEFGRFHLKMFRIIQVHVNPTLSDLWTPLQIIGSSLVQKLFLPNPSTDPPNGASTVPACKLCSL